MTRLVTLGSTYESVETKVGLRVKTNTGRNWEFKYFMKHSVDESIVTTRLIRGQCLHSFTSNSDTSPIYLVYLFTFLGLKNKQDEQNRWVNSKVRKKTKEGRVVWFRQGKE